MMNSKLALFLVLSALVSSIPATDAAARQSDVGLVLPTEQSSSFYSGHDVRFVRGKNTLERLSGINITSPAHTARSLAETFIIKNKPLLGITDAGKLEVHEIVKSVARSIYRFRRIVGGIPVIGADLSISVSRSLRKDHVLAVDPWGFPIPEDQVMFTTSDKVNFFERRNDWKVTSITNYAYVQIDPPARPKISAAAAKSIARVHRGGSLTSTAVSLLGIFVGDRRNPVSRLVYQIYENRPFRAIYVDALTGAVVDDLAGLGKAGITVETPSRSPTESASSSLGLFSIVPRRTSCTEILDSVKIYSSNPGNGALENFNINVCNASPKILKGHFADVTAESRARVSGELTGIVPGDTGWEEISAYHHMSFASQFLYERGIIDDVGITDANIVVIRGQIRQDNQEGISTTKSAIGVDSLVFQEDPGTSSPFLSPLLEAAVIAHEVGHVFHGEFSTLAFCAGAQERCAISEALPDYFGIVYRNFREGQVSAPWLDPILGDYFVNDPTDSSVNDLPRDLTLTTPNYDHYSDGTVYVGYSGKTVQSVYDRAMILSTAIMDFDETDGWNTSLSYIIETMKTLPGNPKFSDFRDALIDATTASIVSYNPIYSQASPTYVQCTGTISACEGKAKTPMSGRGIRSTGGPAPRIDTRPPDKYELPWTATVTSVDVFPNPTNGIIRITLTAGSNYDVKISLFDILGRQVDLQTTDGVQVGRRHEFDTSQLPAGFYWVRVVSKNEVISKSFVVVK
jgi:Secretion system C-terminal sorting domain